MPGILPNASSGGQIIRDAGGNCVNPPNVLNAYCPPAGFSTTCEIRALPEDCTGRIMPSQINGIVSELMCLAVALTPEGEWNCGSSCNLSAAFSDWVVNRLPDIVADAIDLDEAICNLTPVGAANAAMRIPVCSGGSVVSVAAGSVANLFNPCAVAEDIAECVISTDAGNLIQLGNDSKLRVLPQPPVAIEVSDTPTIDMSITGSGTVGDPYVISGFAAVSGEPGNAVVAMPDGLFVPGGAVNISVVDTPSVDMEISGTGVLGDPYAVRSDVIISPDDGNMLEERPNGLFVGAITGLYTPTITGVDNVASVIPREVFWYRIGDIVVVTFAHSITPVAANTTVRARVTLPVPSTFAAARDATGVAVAVFNTEPAITAAIAADVTQPDEIRVTFFPSNANSHSLSGQFQYRVLP